MSSKSSSTTPKYKLGTLETPSDNRIFSSSKNSSSIFTVPQEPGQHSVSHLSKTISSNATSSRQKTPALQKISSICQSRTQSRGWASSVSKSTTPHSSSSFNIVALVEGRGAARGEIGLAYVDLKNPVVVLSQFADTQTYIRLATQLNILKPIEIIMPDKVAEGNTRTKLFQRITELFPNITTVLVKRRYFNETKGMQFIKDLCVSEYKTVDLELSCKYYCLSAFAALIKYVEFIQNTVYHANSLKIIYCVSSNTTMIDTSTACRLELVTNEMGKVEHSLYGVLNYTLTPGGNRLLRANLLQPPCDINTINTRLDCIAELIDNEELFYNLKSVVGRFTDTELLLSFCVQVPKNDTIRAAEQNIQNVICLKHTLDLVEPLRTFLAVSKNPLFQTYYQALSDDRFNDLQEKLSLVIHSDTRWQKGALGARFQKCFLIKSNINGLLDIARRTYSETIDDLMELVKQLGEKHNLPLKVGYSSMRGFFIQIPMNHQLKGPEDMPPIFIKFVKNKSVITCTTEDLIKMNDRIKDSINEIMLMSNAIITEVMKTVLKNIGCMYKLTEAVSTLDFLVSLAHVCTLSDHVRPEFCETLAIINGKNPILEKILDSTFIPNHTFLCEENNFVVITGINMSGKSTYLKQVALLQVMAQIGSYVPADKAFFRLTDQIFSRIGSSGSIEKNSSSFMSLMKEANYILKHVTDKSLIILDEIGQGTSREEGCGIAYAICEQLLLTKAFTLCSTHFMPLTKLQLAYPNVSNYHFKVDYTVDNSDGGCVSNFTHTLIKGPCKEQYYGIQIAEMSSMPREVVNEAKRLIQEWNDKSNVTTGASNTVQENSRLIELGMRLSLIARDSILDDESLRKYLKNLQEQYKDLKDTTAPSCSDNCSM